MRCWLACCGSTVLGCAIRVWIELQESRDEGEDRDAEANDRETAWLRQMRVEAQPRDVRIDARLERADRVACQALKHGHAEELERRLDVRRTEPGVDDRVDRDKQEELQERRQAA